MNAPLVPRMRFALVTWLIGGNEPLAGDLIEESAYRPRSWFWRQLFSALVRHAAAIALTSLREPGRLQDYLGYVAVMGVLCFQVLAAGTVLSVVLPAQPIERSEWVTLGLWLASPLAWVVGVAAGRVRPNHPTATVVLCAGVAAIAIAVVAMLTPSPGFLFRPVGASAGVSLALVVALLAGASHAARARA